ncbi:MAG: 4-hydroxy-tetrahydrodipicolinate reductase [Pseudomonadota bacterium]
MDKQEPIRLAVSGASGRMGKAVIHEILSDELQLVSLGQAVHRAGGASEGIDCGVLVGLAPTGQKVGSTLDFSLFDVLIDFSLPDISQQYLQSCVDNKTPLVIGTTGFTAEQSAVIAQAAQDIPIVFAPNMSVGVNLSFHLLETIAKVMGEESDIEIIETHHRHKVDAPSGTAIGMGKAVASALGRSLDDDAIYGRQGVSGVRPRQQIGFSTVRGGDVVGDHTVMFATEGERLELTHKASSRQTFAKGALRAARWLVNQPAGLNDMQDVLGLKKSSH